MFGSNSFHFNRTVIIIGSPEWARFYDAEGKPYWGWTERSWPNKWRFKDDIYGVELHASGPTHLVNVSFADIRTIEGLRRGVGIYWEDRYHVESGVTSAAT